MKQLLVQVERALDIHDKLDGPQVNAVFVFDQLSAHVSFGDGALSAFDMNKSDNAKHKTPVRYNDTVVPHEVRNVASRGQIQRIMVGDQPKVTSTELAERGISPPTTTKVKRNPRCMETAIKCGLARGSCTTVRSEEAYDLLHRSRRWYTGAGIPRFSACLVCDIAL